MSIITNVVCLVLVTVCVKSQCPSGFKAKQANCYKLLPVLSTWAESLRLCDAIQAKLAWIEDAQEDAFVVKMLTEANATGHLVSREVWLGGTDLLLEGLWIWADSMVPVEYTHWAPNEPNNFANSQHCMGMWMQKGFLWDDFSCEQKNYPLCRTIIEVIYDSSDFFSDRRYTEKYDQYG